VSLIEESAGIGDRLKRAKFAWDWVLCRAKHDPLHGLRAERDEDRLSREHFHAMGNGIAERTPRRLSRMDGDIDRSLDFLCHVRPSSTPVVSPGNGGFPVAQTKR